MSYASLAFPRRTKCPPVLRANSVCANRVWFDPERALSADAFRKQYPLHYHLSRYDAAAVWATLKAGADPARRDAAGRTVLELAVEAALLQLVFHLAYVADLEEATSMRYRVRHNPLIRCTVMAFELLETCFCTSTPVDNVDTPPATVLSSSNASSPQTATEIVVANPFVTKYKDACNNLYDHSDRMRFDARSKAHRSELHQQMPFLFRSPEQAGGSLKKRFLPAFRAQREPEIDADEGRGMSSFPLPDEDVTSFYSPSHGGRPQQLLYAYNEKGRPSPLEQLERDQARLEQRQLQQSFLIVVNDFFQRPPNKAALAQMRDLIRRLNLLLTVVEKFSESPSLRRDAAEKAGDQLARYITYPYLYIATMHQLFKGYPKALNGEVWDVLNPGDSRRLVLTIQSLRLRGHELLSFLGTVCRLFDALLSTIHVVDTGKTSKGRCFGGECGQYYLHMAFTLDSVGLFQNFVLSSRLFGRRDIFKWEDLLYTLMESRDRFREYLAPLLVKRLKARVQRRFVEEAEKKAEYMDECVKYPCEERCLTRRLLEEYGDIFGPQEAEELSAVLRRWRYGAARPVPSREADWHGHAPWLLKAIR